MEVGKHKYYYPNGKIKEEGKYSAGLKDGDWKKYNEEGELVLTIFYLRIFLLFSISRPRHRPNIRLFTAK